MNRISDAQMKRKNVFVYFYICQLEFISSFVFSYLNKNDLEESTVVLRGQRAEILRTFEFCCFQNGCLVFFWVLNKKKGSLLILHVRVNLLIMVNTEQPVKKEM